MKTKKNILFIIIYIFSFIPISAQEIFIKNGENWKYYDQGNLADNWYLNTKTSN